MKNILLLILLNSACITVTLAQDLQKLYNHNWVRVKSEWADGSKIIERGVRQDAYSRIKFIKPSAPKEKPSAILSGLPYENITEEEYVVTYEANQLHFEKKINSDRLSFVVHRAGQIDKLTDSILVFTSINAQGKYGRREYFIPEKEYFDLVIKLQLVKQQEDTLYANNFLFPSYKGGLEGELRRKLSFVNFQGEKDGVVMASFIVTPEGKITYAQINSMGGVPERFKGKIEEALNTLENKWELTNVGAPFFYKLNFNLVFFPSGKSRESFSSIKMIDSVNVPVYQKLSVDHALKAYELCQIGIQLLQKKKFIAAVAKFSESIALDNLYIDAYYARASANLELKEYEKSCEDWKFLIELGQVEATTLYSTHCRK